MLGTVIYGIRSATRAVRNAIRGLSKPPNYVLFMLEDEYPELPEPPQPFWQRLTTKPRLSLQELGERFRVVGADRRVEGVILHLRPLNMSMAQLQTLRGFIQDLQNSGKRVIAWSYSYSNGSYYVASACDEITLLDGGTISPLGMQMKFMYLAQSLQQIGLQFDFIQISPYKNATDMFSRTEMSEESREMANWLADSLYEDLVSGIAEGRGKSREEALDLINSTPLIDKDAVEMGAIDNVLSEEDLPSYLGSEQKPAKILPWDEAEGRLMLPRLPKPGRYVALLRIEGDIVDGRSQRPPMKPPVLIPFLTNTKAGDISVVQDARRVLRDPRAASLVVYVDSGGGSATASEAMTAALRRIAARIPVVVYMGSVAGSGGYYVSTPGQHVVAQSASITGSIGVLYGKVVNKEMLNKLLINQESIERGESIDLMDARKPFSDEERSKIQQYIERVYELFLKRVSDARKMSPEEINAVGGGRVWTGKQALEHGLIDEIGDFERAVERARELAGLSEHASVREIYTEKGSLAPMGAAASLQYYFDGVRHLSDRSLYISSLISDWKLI